MFDTYKMQEMVCKEMEKKAERGSIPSQADLDTIWKLTDIYKNLLKIDMLQEAGEYSYDGGDYSERRRRDARGRYSRDGGYDRDSSYRDGNRGGYSEARGEYMDAKHSYRSTRSADSKRDMTASLEDCKHKLRQEMQDMLNGADTREEREAIKAMIREIGSLA
ncbi:MAG: hypothetical protein J6B95_08230 [Oscillospiraceae bacterium]|nr:hypothetical protein [Oscillospiraceae bacterium]